MTTNVPLGLLREALTTPHGFALTTGSPSGRKSVTPVPSAAASDSKVSMDGRLLPVSMLEIASAVRSICAPSSAWFSPAARR